MNISRQRTCWINHDQWRFRRKAVNVERRQIAQTAIPRMEILASLADLKIATQYCTQCQSPGMLANCAQRQLRGFGTSKPFNCSAILGSKISYSGLRRLAEIKSAEIDVLEVGTPHKSLNFLSPTLLSCYGQYCRVTDYIGNEHWRYITPRINSLVPRLSHHTLRQCNATLRGG